MYGHWRTWILNALPFKSRLTVCSESWLIVENRGVIDSPFNDVIYTYIEQDGFQTLQRHASGWRLQRETKITYELLGPRTSIKWWKGLRSNTHFSHRPQCTFFPLFFHNHCFFVSFGTAVIPTRDWKQWSCAKFFRGWWGGGGVKKVYSGLCENGCSWISHFYTKCQAPYLLAF